MRFRLSIRTRAVGGLLVVAAGLMLCASGAVAQGNGPAVGKRTLHAGWAPLDPYEYLDTKPRIPHLTGLDIEVMRAIARRLGWPITFEKIDWDDHLKALAQGRLDIAAAASVTAERRLYAYFSKPYRQSTIVLVVRRGAAAQYPFKTVEEMLATFERTGFRLGVISGHVFPSRKLDAFIADPARAAQIIAVDDHADNLDNLLAGRIDGFLAERVVAATVAWRSGPAATGVEEHPMRLTEDVTFMLSRASVSEAEVAAIDRAIGDMQTSEEYDRISSVYALPVLLVQIVDSNWFVALQVIGTIAFAISGILIGIAGGYSVFGTTVLAILPSVGGGVMRDIVAQRSPLAVVESPAYLFLAIGTVLAGYVVIRLYHWVAKRGIALPVTGYGDMSVAAVEVCDALGLAALIVVGTLAALSMSMRPLWLWGPILAVLTTSGGGVLRDMLRSDASVTILKGKIYAEVALIWGFMFALFLGWQTRRLNIDEVQIAVIITTAGAFVTRMAAVLFNLDSPTYPLIGRSRERV